MKQKLCILITHCTTMQKRQALEPVSKKAFLLHQNQVSELIIGSDSDESQSDVHVTEDEEFCEEILLDHTYNCRVSTQHVTVLEFHLAWIQLVPLKMMHQVGELLRCNRHQNCSEHYPIAFEGM